ncbi:hydroxyacylglutathione hydrolase [Pseudotabrizicola sp.]|jgi:hydroxyacylglutathione hydrolase|uniref:hydroxyacylglutathione hydrolase n=1 Tax=Pseudotabrizicola sp. TaxID=2939647 RepID=UPI0027205A02|nr:hydroxyacylglutathione hydrolase [Pseudotabrizicola sp.]MDO8881949.1 hydroxyacylglutathione hydrolase [Pseudotabrizicola sp.]
MPLDLVTIPCLKDNYAFLIHDANSGATAVIDVPDAAPVLAALETRGWQLSDILITHHHDDHIAGVDALRAATGAKVWGAKADAHRLPRLDHALTEGDTVTIGAHGGTVFDVSGHTVGHIAFHFPGSGLVFTADSLMAAGCGRLFEGSPDVMWASLSKLAALPPETLVCSGHEYTLSNICFALSLEPDNPALISRFKRVTAAREDVRPTVPSTLSEELATNPFLRAAFPELKAAVGMAGASDAEVFTEIRKRKDRF